MASQIAPSGSITLHEDFQIDEIRPVRQGSLGEHAALPVSPPPPPLGVLANFVGEFAGTGFNTIFRPNSRAPTTTTFPKPVNPVPPTPPSENVLELNLTSETLSFAGSLGRVPNRGLEGQNDIFLNGVPYTQSISDVTNPDTGKGDGAAIPIHFEPGLWMNIPATSNTPELAGSLTRMASIPHGTTINAQCLAPTTSIPGRPTIPPTSMTPFVIGSSPPKLIPFAAQTATNGDAPRIPQDLSKFIEAGTITQAILNDPNTVLRDALDGQTITKTVTFTVSSNPAAPEFGGGTGNIAFLEGDAKAVNPNANAVQVEAQFWIETVEHKSRFPRSSWAPHRLRSRRSRRGRVRAFPCSTSIPRTRLPRPRRSPCRRHRFSIRRWCC